MTLPNPSTAAATVVLDELVRNGVEHVALAPGSRSAALALAAVDHARIRVHVEIDERSAAFFALGVGAATGRPAVVVTTSGSATAHLHPAIIEADTGRVPLIVITADRPVELLDVGANQTIDQVGLFGSSVRWFSAIPADVDHRSADSYWRTTVDQAVAASSGLAGPPGPVHVNMAFREPLVPASDDGRTKAEPFEADVEGRPGSQPWTVRRGPEVGPVDLPEWVVGTERGIVVEGSVGAPALAWADGVDGASGDFLAARLGWPLISEPTSGRRPAQAISTAHHLLGHDGFLESHLPDVAVVLGRVGLSRRLSALLSRVPTIVVDPWGWPDPTRSAWEMLVGWPAVGDVSGRSSDWRRSWLEVEAVARQAIDEWLDASGTTEPRVVRDTARAASGGALYAASSMPIRDLDWFMEPGDLRILSNRGASGIDGFVSSAMGAAAAISEPVTAIAGDLSLLHDSNGFLLHDRPSCVFVVINNDGGGIFSMLPQVAYPENFELVFGTPHGRSFEALADFHGLVYRRIRDAGDLEGAVRDAHTAGDVHLIEVQTSRTANVDVHRQATEVVGRALDEAGLEPRA